MAPAPQPYPAAGSYAEAPYPEAPVPPTEAFVPPELLARRRAAAPPSQPYQPIAGFSTTPLPQGPPPAAYPMNPAGPITSATPVSGAGPQQPATGAIPAGPANGFATPPGAPGQPGPASAAPVRRDGAAATGGGRRSVWTSPPVLAAAGVLVIVGLVIGGLFWNNGGDPKTTPKPVASATVPPKAPAPLKFTVSSYTTSGSGFRDKGTTWESATYNTVKFGNLKPGIGLVLDLGSAKEVTSVSFNAETGPMKVELRAANEKPSGASDGEIVGEATSANGKTDLPAAKGGKHQYWMIWVTELGPTRKAVVSGISAAAVPAP